MEDLESELSAFTVGVKSGWICTKLRDGESNLAPGGVILPLFSSCFFSPEWGLVK